jgi:hypothetical protein|tara:strand:+ start:2475 stop:2870 length:396 start_codon:yes stop_codon:yes gene_type:complete
MFETLDDSNFMLYAAKFYDNPRCVDIIEFNEDVNRIKYLRRLFRRYSTQGDMNHRLILNHLIALYNVFEERHLTRMLFYKCYEYLEYLKPFLVFLNQWPNVPIKGIGLGDEIIDPTFVVSDEDIEKVLQKI